MAERWPCRYVAGTCRHGACGESYDPGPTEDDYCAAGGHAYYGDEEGRGRCCCGTRTYPAGGPPEDDDG